MLPRFFQMSRFPNALYVENFPAIVVIDSQGNNLYESELPKYAK